MKKTFTIILLSSLLLVGCGAKSDTAQQASKNITQSPTVTATEAPKPNVFENLPESFIFSSGAGGWSTELFIEKDGSFYGTYHDSEMGSTGKKYPNGTVYICNFVGTFTEPKQLDEYSYSMQIKSLETENKPDKKYIEDGIKYICTEPYGLEDAKDIILYLPGYKINKLPKGYKSWFAFELEDSSETLDFYGLYNENAKTGFAGYKNDF